jgi:hypothetical protein
MPPKKRTSTPNKPPKNPNWTLDEGEEMRREINYLQKKTITKYRLQEMEAKLEAINTKMDGLNEEIMERLKIFIIERTPESENVSHEIHDEDTRKVNQEWRNSNFGLKTNHVPKINMQAFDGKDPITWIPQMEQFFDLHNVPHTKKVLFSSLYLEPNQFVWYRWLCSRKSLITWTIFTEEMIAHYEDTRSNTVFSQLINLKQKGLVTEHIENFRRLNIKVTDIISYGMKKLLKKGHQGVIAQLCSLDVQTSKPYIPLDIQGIIDKHSKVFEDIPKGLPPT